MLSRLLKNSNTGRTRTVTATDGYTVDLDGEVLDRPRNGAIRRQTDQSPDGNVDWCSVNGRNDGRTICLYVLPRSI